MKCVFYSYVLVVMFDPWLLVESEVLSLDRQNWIHCKFQTLEPNCVLAWVRVRVHESPHEIRILPVTIL